MTRRGILLGLVPALCLSMLGCETFGRRAAKPHAAETTDEILSKPEDAESDARSGSKSFFKPTRLQGGASSEARAIENELGVRN